ncbi:MAG: hypothetical protein JWM80_4189 [Cyanobacteria bacterium RYN_339]|nr:hypothetical protein [Cyanobacteria bacterium RYN_339]
MPKYIPLVLLTLLLAQACKITPVDVPTPKASKAVATASAAPPKPGPNLLKRPAGDVSVLTGSITLDANYIVAQGGGNLIANDGGSIITHDGGSLVVDQGNAIITHDGGSLIGNDGGGLIGNDGGGLIGNDGASYALLAAQEVPVGQMLPIAGAQVAVRSLDTGKLLPLGNDADGNPVMTVVSNRQGKFELYLPAGGTNVRVETAFHTGGDKVQAYGALSTGATGSCTVDEDTQLVSQFIFDAYAIRFAGLMTQSRESFEKNQTFKPFLEQLKPFRDLAAGMPPDRAKRASRRAAEFLLGQAIALSHAPVYDLSGADPVRMGLARQRNEERKLDNSAAVLVDVFRTIRRAVVARMRKQANPEDYFNNLPVIAAYRASLNPGFRFKHATDFPQFMVNAYLGADLADDGGVALSEKARFGGLGVLLEAEAPAAQVLLPPKWQALFPAASGPDAPPALSAALTGANGLGADGIPRGESYRLSSATRAVTLALLEPLFLAPDAESNRARLFDMLKAVQ